MDSIDTPMEKEVEIRGVFATQGDQDEVGERVGGGSTIFLDEGAVRADEAVKHRERIDLSWGQGLVLHRCGANNEYEK